MNRKKTMTYLLLATMAVTTAGSFSVATEAYAQSASNYVGTPGILKYTPTAEEKAKFGFKYAFIDKQGELRKFAELQSANIIYKVIYKTTAPITPNGIYKYAPTTEEKAKFDFKYAFIDKQGQLRKFSQLSNAQLVYDSIYKVSSTTTNGSTSRYPSGIFNYTPTPEEKAKFDFKYAFVDKEGELRKFASISTAQVIYKSIYKVSAPAPSKVTVPSNTTNTAPKPSTTPTSGSTSNYPRIFNYTPTPEEKAKFDFKYAFVDKEGELRKFASISSAQVVYKSIYKVSAPAPAKVTFPSTVTSPSTPASGSTSGYPSGIFKYTPTPEEKAKFDFKYAFVDKQGELRKFASISSAQVVYRSVYK